MTVFELQISGVGSNRCTNCATTADHNSVYYTVCDHFKNAQFFVSKW